VLSRWRNAEIANSLLIRASKLTDAMAFRGGPGVASSFRCRFSEFQIPPGNSRRLIMFSTQGSLPIDFHTLNRPKRQTLLFDSLGGPTTPLFSSTKSPMQFHVGTCGYCYLEWKGSFYPEKIRQKQILGFYTQSFSTVETNRTFYRIPEC
jgi:Protein of unknown function DUF72